MEQILTLKVDLEHPDDAKFAIDEAVKVYESEKLKWTAEDEDYGTVVLGRVQH